MPVYDYMCEDCGPFTQMHPMRASGDAQPCPACALLSPRAFLSVPYLAGMDSARRTAFATNERSAHAPMTSGQYAAKTHGTKTHGAGCGCCAPKTAGRTRTAVGGAKSFPSARPWMISH